MPTSSTRPLKNESTASTDGKRRRRDISAAVSYSGLTVIEMPKSPVIMFDCAEYSGFLTRAIVCFTPIFFATRQLRMLSSSIDVVAISSSADCAPASIWVL